MKTNITLFILALCYSFTFKAQVAVVSTLAGSGVVGFANGQGATAQFNNPTGVAVDGGGGVYVADYKNHCIRKISAAGAVTTLAGSGVAGFLDGQGTAAQFNYPSGIVYSGAIVYVADASNNRIRKVDIGGGVTTLAGSGVAGTQDGIGSAATFNNPSGIAVSPPNTGVLYVTDKNVGGIRQVQQPTGAVYLYTGGGLQGFADGQLIAAVFNNPYGIAIDVSGNIYVADQLNQRIRKISGGTVTTLAGSGIAGFADGQGAAAQFNNPSGVAVDASGNVYVADFGNNRIRKISASGAVTTLAGSGIAGFADGQGSAAKFSGPSGIAVDAAGNLYVADANNHRIRKLNVVLVQTNPVSVITSTTASLNGLINAGSYVTTASFEYGTTTAYGSTISATPSSITGSTNTSINAGISGLLPNTTYHCRAVGTNSTTTINGADVSFTTLPICVVQTQAASSVSYTIANLTGMINAKNNITTAGFEYGTTTAYGTTVAATPSSITSSANTNIITSLSGLLPNTTYHYRAVGTNSLGTVNGSDLTFTTLASIAPIVTTNSATAISVSAANFNGTVNATGDTSTVTFEYGTTTSLGSSIAATPNIVSGSNATSVSATVTGLSSNTTYYFRVKATNSLGTSLGNILSFTTLPACYVVTQVANTISSTSANLAGSVDALGNTTTANFEYGLSTAYGSSATATPSSITGSGYTMISETLSGLLPSTTYYYRAVGSNSIGTVYGINKTFTTLPICVVQTQAASAVSYTTTNLVGIVNANVGSNIATCFEYGLTSTYGSNIAATPNSVTGGTNASISASLSGLIPNTIYHYRAVGSNSLDTVYGTDVTFTTLPTCLVQTQVASLVSYTTATFNGLINANGNTTTASFEYGLTTAYGSNIAAVPGFAVGGSNTNISATLSGLFANTTYHYRAVGSNSLGTTTGSDTTFTTLAYTAPTVITGSTGSITSNSAMVYATVQAGGQNSTVVFEYGTTPAYGSSIAATPNTVSGNSVTNVSATISGLLPNTAYLYRVKATNSVGSNVGNDMTFNTIAAGINELQNNNISIYPNPASTQLNIKGLTKIDKIITLTNVLGELVKIIENKGNSTLELNVESLPAGIYFIKINNSSYKFVKE